MTKEQAIERLKSKLDNDKEYLEQCNPFSDLVNEVRLDNKSIEIVLSMLEEKDKTNDLMANEIDSLHSSLIGEFGTWKTEYSEQGEEATIEEIKQYFENKAKEKNLH